MGGYIQGYLSRNRAIKIHIERSKKEKKWCVFLMY